MLLTSGTQTPVTN